MIGNGLIEKTKGGLYYDKRFKFDRKTKAQKYGANERGYINLSTFIDLSTGEWKKQQANSPKILYKKQ